MSHMVIICICYIDISCNIYIYIGSHVNVMINTHNYDRVSSLHGMSLGFLFPFLSTSAVAAPQHFLAWTVPWSLKRHFSLQPWLLSLVFHHHQNLQRPVDPKWKVYQDNQLQHLVCCCLVIVPRLRPRKLLDHTIQGYTNQRSSQAIWCLFM